MEKIFIDINCDVGEGLGNEKELFPHISSCNIACGGHAGDVGTMGEVALLALSHHVRIGAHPSYPDRENFGRTSMDLSPLELRRTLGQQIDSLIGVLERAGATLDHIKPHGALYNDVAKDISKAKAFLKAVSPYRESVFLYLPYGSVVASEARFQGFKVQLEAFADRNYLSDLSLVSRKRSNAVIEEPKEVLAHLIRMVKNGVVRTLDGTETKILAHTYCIHGDTPTVLQILMYLSKELRNHLIFLKK
ncbi:MAG: 5-oxoprolinase subunit PxpA [Sediminicola sp.]